MSYRNFNITCVCLCVREHTPWDSAVVSASHLVTWWRAGQLWVVCRKVSWLSKQPGGVCACLCVCLITPLSVCLCVCIRIWETVLPFCSWNCSGFWVMADSTHSHTHTHTLFISSKPPTTSTTTTRAAHSVLPRWCVCVLVAALLIVTSSGQLTVGWRSGNCDAW